MKQTLNQAITVPAGMKMKLTKAQASARSHLLGKGDAGTYELEHSLEFKAGENIEIVGDIPKGLLPAFDDDQQSNDDPVDIEQLAKTIIGLDKEDKANWTKTEGVPDLKALTKAFGKKVTGEQRDQALTMIHNVHLEKIAGTIVAMDESDETLWTDVEGVPTLEALEKAFGEPVSEADRDAALKLVVTD
jgi:hypothetical protein